MLFNILVCGDKAIKEGSKKTIWNVASLKDKERAKEEIKWLLYADDNFNFNS